MADWEYIKPTGDSSTVNLYPRPVDGTTHYDKVNDDDVASYVYKDLASWSYDRYIMANPTFRGTDIKKIRLFALGRRNNALAAGRFSIDSGGVYNANSVIWGEIYPGRAWEAWTFKLNPITAGAWTLAQIDALEAGVGHYDTGIPSGVITYEFFICVIWTEASVQTDAASGYTGTTAVLNGTILQNEGNFVSKLTYSLAADQTRVRFNWGTDITYGTNTAWQNIASGSFDADISGLDPAIQYHFRAEIQVRDNDQNWESFYGSDKVVNPVAPTVTTQAVSNIAVTTATGNGNVTDLGAPNPTQHGHCWSTSPNPTVADDKTELGPKAATGAFTSSLTGLSPGTLYYCRAYATNDAGTSYGTQVTFTTIGSSTVTTDPATSVEATGATLNGTLDDDGGEACDSGFEWGETTAYGNTTPTQSRTTGQTFSQAISGLSPNTTYHFRAFATNAAGTSYGADQTFITEVAMPSVTTDAATGGLVTSALLNGTLDDDGGEACDCGFEWGETVAYGRTTPTQSRTTGQTFSQTITGLDTDTTYYFRAFARNSAGVTYGDGETFATVQAKGRHYALGRHEL